MSRKIIIISHDSKEYKVESGYPLSKLIDSEAFPISNRYLEAYDFIKSNHQTEDTLVNFLRENSPEDLNLKDIKDFIDDIDKEKHPDKWYGNEIPESLTVFLKENKDSSEGRNMYDRIEIKNNEDIIVDEIFILYWNRTKKYASRPGLLLSLVCKDCQIDNTTDNLLYIHEGEWLGEAKSKATDEEKGDNLLIFGNNKTATASINESILDELIKQNFSFVASFKHVDSPDRFFHKILNRDFGTKTLSYEMGLIEKNTSIKDFLNLKTEIESLW